MRTKEMTESESDAFEYQGVIFESFDTKCGQLQNLSQGSNTSHRDASEGAISIKIKYFNIF